MATPAAEEQSMAALAAAAVAAFEAAPREVAVDKPAAAKRKRSDALTAQQTRVDAAKAKALRLAQGLASKHARYGTPAAASGRARELKMDEEKVKEAEAAIPAAEAKLQELKDKAAAKQSAAEQAAAKAAEKAEAAKPMSDEGRFALVKTKFKHEKKFRNTKDRTMNIWKDDVHPDFIALVDSGDLIESDRRDADSLQAKFLKDMGLFRQHCQLLQRAASSGAPREALEQCSRESRFRNVTTDAFFAARQAEAPMSVPPLVINGGNAAQGGDANYITELLKEETPELESEDDEQHDLVDSDLEEFAHAFGEEEQQPLQEEEEEEEEEELGEEECNSGGTSSGSPTSSHDHIFDSDEADLGEDDEDGDKEESSDHSAAKAHEKYRPGSERKRQARKSKDKMLDSDFIMAMKEEGKADRKAAKAAQMLALQDASKARKHERALMVMLMKGLKK